MTTRSLAIANRIETLLSSFAGIKTHRDIVRAIDRAERIALVVEHGDELAPALATLTREQRVVEINLSVVVKGQAPYSVADPVLTSAHNLIMADKTLGGLARKVAEGETRRERDAMEREVGVVTKTYRVEYSTAPGQLI